LQARLNIILVVPNKLGCINDALLNYQFIKSNELDFYGFAMNNFFTTSINDKENKTVINRLTNDSVVCEFNDKLLYFKDI
jgi:dethiobiotin synthetase